MTIYISSYVINTKILLNAFDPGTKLSLNMRSWNKINILTKRCCYGVAEARCSAMHKVLLLLDAWTFVRGNRLLCRTVAVIRPEINYTSYSCTNSHKMQASYHRKDDQSRNRQRRSGSHHLTGQFALSVFHGCICSMTYKDFPNRRASACEM